MARFDETEWMSIHAELESHPDKYELPHRREGSIILSSFNIRALSSAEERTPSHEKGRTAGAWKLMADYASRCDFIAIQEVGDNLDGLLKLKSMLKHADKYALVVSDVTGGNPYDRAKTERLAFLYRWDRVERTELASDLTYDKSAILDALFDDWEGFRQDYEEYRAKLQHFQDHGGDEPVPEINRFLTFIRTPHVASFKIKGDNGASLPFLAVNAHLLYGHTPQQRKQEFDALLKWLKWRTHASGRLYHENMILMGDLNLEFGLHHDTPTEYDNAIKAMNNDVGAGYRVNFPFLSTPDKRASQGLGAYKSTARMEATYDQIGLFGKNGALPDHLANIGAGGNGKDGFDYGVFAFADLFAKALHNTGSFLDLPDRSDFVKRFEWDVSDHHPIWVRLPKPG